MKLQYLDVLKSLWLFRREAFACVGRYIESGYFLGCLRGLGVREQRSSKLIRYLGVLIAEQRVPSCSGMELSGGGSRPTRLLMTNYSISKRTGTEIYVCDTAQWLQERAGIEVLIYSPILGDLAGEYRRRGVRFTDSISEALAFSPELVHMQHYFRKEIAALYRMLPPDTPVLNVLHGVAPKYEEPMLFRSNVSYVGVSDLICAKVRYITAGKSVVERVENFSIFHERFGDFLPKRALLLSSRFPRDLFDALKVGFACEGVDLTWKGYDEASKFTDLKTQCQPYEIVLGTGKTALDALCLGKRVILCEDGVLGPAITTENFDFLRGMNFALVSSLVKVDYLEGSRVDHVLTSRMNDLLLTDADGLSALVANCHIDRVLPKLVSVYSALHGFDQ